MKQLFITVAALTALMALSVTAQTSPDDPAIAQAKEDTVVVFDLGRIFGFIHTIEKEEPKLALSKDQLQQLYSIMESINNIERVEPDEAEDMLVKIEDEILTPDQLMHIDQLAIARAADRESATTDRVAGSGGGQITSYVAGGAFNPMKDASKTIGKDFAAFYDYLKKKLG